jgi:glutamyl-tRNA reductase
VLNAMSHALSNKLLHAPTHALNHATSTDREQLALLVSQLYGLHQE